MPDPFRLKVLKALTTALEEITVANGYQHDLAGAVHRGRIVLTQEDGLPALAINEPPQMPEDFPAPQASSASLSTLPLLIQGFVQDDREHPTDPAYRLLADVQQRLARERKRGDGYDILGLGKRVSALDMGRAVVRPPDSYVSDNSFFWLQVTLEIGEDYENPFA